LALGEQRQNAQSWLAGKSGEDLHPACVHGSYRGVLYAFGHRGERIAEENRYVKYFDI